LGDWKLGDWKLGDWKLGDWKFEIGNLRLEIGNSKLVEIGSWKSRLQEASADWEATIFNFQFSIIFHSLHSVQGQAAFQISNYFKFQIPSFSIQMILA
jgi:hypothetical protein